MNPDPTPQGPPRARTAQRTHGFTESVIREMTRLCAQHGGVNLAQGFPDFPCPRPLKDAAIAAIEADVNQYAITWGAKGFRDALVAKTQRFYGLEYDPETEVTVTCGSTEAMIATLLALVNPGEEVIVFEPFYENYGPDAILSGATPRFVRLQRARLVVRSRRAGEGVQRPHARDHRQHAEQPDRQGVLARRARADRRRCASAGTSSCVTDEIYEHMVYDGLEHVPMATLPGMRDRTVTISGLSKTYSVTGWRVGTVLAPPDLTVAIRKVHDFLTVGAPAPLMEAGVAALQLDEAYYRKLAADYDLRRNYLVPALDQAGFRTFRPHGAYYVMTDISSFGFADDVTFARWLVEHVGVAAVPGSSFYSDPAAGRQRLRFHFARLRQTLEAAVERLSTLRARLPASAAGR